MFNLQGSEIIFILLIALVVLGPEKLPDAVRRFTRTYHELKRMGSGFQSEIRSAFDEPISEIKSTASLLEDAMDPAAMVEADKPKSVEMKPAAEMSAEPDRDGEPGPGPTDDEPVDDGPDLLSADALDAIPSDDGPDLLSAESLAAAADDGTEPTAAPRNSVAAANSSAAIDARRAASAAEAVSEDQAPADDVSGDAGRPGGAASDVDDRRDEAAHT